MEDLDTPARRAQRYAVAVAVAGTAVLFWRSANEVFAGPKLTVLLLATLVAACCGLQRALARASLRVPTGAAAYALAAFLVLAAGSVVTSDSTWRSLYGTYSRASGFATYLSAAGLFWATTVAVSSERHVRRLLGAIAGGVLVVGGYGLLQRLGVDPWEWRERVFEDAPISTFGNTNFVSGYLAIGLPIVVVGALLARETWRRAALAGGAVLLVVVIVATDSVQGVVAAVAGAGVLALVLVIERGGRHRRTLVAGIGAVGAVAALVVALGVSGSGPASGLNDTGVDYRREYWSTAIDVAADNPVTGVGFDRWSVWYRAERSADAALDPLENVADSPHSVPLAMFAGGGVPLGVAYLAFVALVLVALVRGLRRTTGVGRLLLGATGAAWVAFQVQSAVSVDQPAFATVHLVLAALVVVQSGAVTTRLLTIAPLVAGERRGSRHARTRPPSRVTAGAATAVAVVIGLVGAWQLTRPIRADLAFASGREAAALGERSGLTDMNRATKLVPWESEYWSGLGGFFARTEAAHVAAEFYGRALDNDPRSFQHTLNRARALAASDQADLARAAFERALELEPNAPALRAEAGRFLASNFEPAEEGLALLRAAIDQREEPAWLLWLGEAAMRDGRTDEGARAIERALELRFDRDTVVAAARAYRIAGDLERAHELLDPLVASDTGVPEVDAEARLLAEADEADAEP